MVYCCTAVQTVVEFCPGSRAKYCTTYPGALQALHIHLQSSVKAPMLASAGDGRQGEDRSLRLFWHDSSYVLFHTKGCDQQKHCQPRSLASLWAMGLLCWFMQPWLFLLLLKCDIGWQLCGISHMETLLHRDGRNWTNCSGFSHMGPIHVWWTPVEAVGTAPAERLTRHIHWLIVVLFVMIKALEIFFLMGDHAEFQHVLLCWLPVSVVTRSSGVVCACLKGEQWTKLVVEAANTA